MAAQLGWRLKAKGRRPKGYWDDPANVRSELDEFIEEQGLPPGVMPAKNDFVRAGRYDIARAVERWGGLYEVRRERGLVAGGGWPRAAAASPTPVGLPPLLLPLPCCTACAPAPLADPAPLRHATLTAAPPQLAEELGYSVSDSRKGGSTEWQEHISEVAATTGLSGREVRGRGGGGMHLLAQTADGQLLRAQAQGTWSPWLASPDPLPLRPPLVPLPRPPGSV